MLCRAFLSFPKAALLSSCHGQLAYRSSGCSKRQCYWGSEWVHTPYCPSLLTLLRFARCPATFSLTSTQTWRTRALKPSMKSTRHFVILSIVIHHRWANFKSVSPTRMVGDQERKNSTSSCIFWGPNYPPELVLYK